jgi:hypothetical protein
VQRLTTHGEISDLLVLNQKVWGSNLSGAHLFHLVTSRHALVVFRSSSIVTEL